MNLKNSPGKRISKLLLICICSSLLLLLIVNGPASDLYHEARNLQAQLQVIRQEKEKLLAIKEETARINEGAGFSSAEQDRLALSIPLEKDLPLALANLEEMVLLYPLNLNNLKTAQKNRQDVTGTMQVELGISGSKEEIDLFLSQIINLPHLFTLDSIIWSQDGEGDNNADLSLVLEFYYIDPHELDPGLANQDF